MKKAYEAPRVKHVDFNYEEQVVATSSPCIHYNLWSLENPTTVLCQDNLMDKPQKRSANPCVWILEN